VTETLLGQMKSEPPPEQSANVCRGTLLSWQQYLHDVRERGLEDARLHPRGNLAPEQVERWTAAEK
jgi:hypothetical protein